MADVREYVAAELENIGKTLREIPPGSLWANLSTLEWAGVAALLHSFYNGIENALKQVVISRGLDLPRGDSWHRDLLALAGSAGVLSLTTVESLKPFLAFRHFFSHSYALDLQPTRLEPLLVAADRVFLAVRRDIAAALRPAAAETGADGSHRD